jgi:hypothetical protein
MAFANTSITDIIATTIQNRSRVIADNVTKNNALLDRLQRRGNVKTFSGGNVILQELSFAENSNAGWYSGYETLPVAASDVISAASYNIKQCAVPVTISGLEQLQNAGREQIIDLLEGRIAVAEATMANLIAAGIYSDGTGYGGKEIDGLKLQVPTTPTTGSPGDINRANYTFWQSQVLDATDSGGATTAANIQQYFNALWAKCVRGSDKPDIIIVDNAYWAYYVASLQANQQFTSSQDGNAGFVSLKFMNSDVILDGGIGGNMASKEAYFLNTKYLFFRPHASRNMVPLSPKARYAVNQDAEVQILAWAGNLTSSGLQFQGKMKE